MEPTISLEIRTSYGEDLYVYPYSFNYRSKKLFYYRSSEYSVIDTNYVRKFEVNNLYKKLVKYGNCFKEWFELFSWQFEDFFGSAVFDKDFKYRTWSLYLDWLRSYLELSCVFTAESVFKDITLKGQLQIQNPHKYINEYYLTPTKEYFDNRLEEWLNEDVADIVAKDIYASDEYKLELFEYETELRQDYRNWRNTEIAKGNRIEYLYSLNS